MQILCIFFHPQPYITALGGAEKRFLETSRVWIEKGVKIAVIEPEPSLLSKLAANYQVCALSQSIRLWEEDWLKIYLGWVIWMLKACLVGAFVTKQRRPSIVLATNNTLPNLIPAYFIHIVSHLPLCVIVHHIDVSSLKTRSNLLQMYHTFRKIQYDKLPSLLKALAFSISLFIIRRSNINIAVSSSTAKTLLINEVPKKRVYISGNGVNINYIEKFKFDGNKSYDGVFVGRISKEKGIFSIIKAWQKVTEVKPNAKIAIIGSGVELNKFKKIVADYRLEGNIVILGRCTDKDMYEKMKASKVFVFPSLLEGWGLAVAEALACGLPVVCYDIPAIREVFGNCKSVFLVPLGDIDKLASTIIEILQMDLNAFENISKTYVKYFDWDNVSLKDLEIIRCVTNSKGLGQISNSNEKSNIVNLFDQLNQ